MIRCGFLRMRRQVKSIWQRKSQKIKIVLMAMRYEKKDFPRMYGLLFSIGANSVIWNNGTDEQIEIDLEKIVRRPDLR